MLIGFALARSVTGDEVTDLPSAIEDITPAPDAVQVLQQTQVVVDLAEGYEGRLVIDDVALPTIRLDELRHARRRAGPAARGPAGRRVRAGQRHAHVHARRRRPDRARFDPGSHTVQVVFWRTVEGEETRPLLHLVVHHDLTLTRPECWSAPECRTVENPALQHSAAANTRVSVRRSPGGARRRPRRGSGTPTCSALVTLLAPGLSPTTRAYVLALTLPGLLPPRATIAASASSRV